jgi:hypothetical protein
MRFTYLEKCLMALGIAWLALVIVMIALDLTGVKVG